MQLKPMSSPYLSSCKGLASLKHMKFARLKRLINNPLNHALSRHYLHVMQHLERSVDIQRPQHPQILPFCCRLNLLDYSLHFLMLPTPPSITVAVEDPYTS